MSAWMKAEYRACCRCVIVLQLSEQHDLKQQKKLKPGYMWQRSRRRPVVVCIEYKFGSILKAGSAVVDDGTVPDQH